MIHVNLLYDSVSDLPEELRKKKLGKISESSADVLYSETPILNKSLAFLYSEKIIGDEELDKAIEGAVLKQARADYEFLIGRRTSYNWADSLPMRVREVLAYGIEKGIFSDEELEKIPFDHGENPGIFCQKYGNENLISELREKLLKPSAGKHKEVTGKLDPHPACC